jgi:hypothetical protein
MFILCQWKLYFCTVRGTWDHLHEPDVPEMHGVSSRIAGFVGVHAKQHAGSRVQHQGSIQCHHGNTCRHHHGRHSWQPDDNDDVNDPCFYNNTRTSNNAGGPGAAAFVTESFPFSSPCGG